jgi:hypothetical protein
MEVFYSFWMVQSLEGTFLFGTVCKIGANQRSGTVIVSKDDLRRPTTTHSLYYSMHVVFHVKL